MTVDRSRPQDPCTEARPPVPAAKRRRKAVPPLALAFGREELGGYERLVSREWLETNGLGGWASGTLAGAHTRRYHGWLVVATKPPVGRRVLVSKLAETVLLADGGRVELDSNSFPGALHPRGFERLERFELELFPAFSFRFENKDKDKDFLLKRGVAGVHGENCVVVSYELCGSSSPVELELRPFFAGRDIHELRRAAPEREWRLASADEARGAFRFSSLAGEPDVTISAPGARFLAGPDWWRDFEYAEERARGFDFVEDLFTPGVLRLRLEPGTSVAVVLSTETGPRDGAALLAGERARREGLLSRAGFSDPLAQRLVLAADQFLVRRGAEWTVIAGYPWFADWGRDAMIALPGLCLSTGRHEEAKGILRAFARAADRGMLPNRFPDDGEAPEYNTVDATLWLFVAAWRYLEATGDEAFVRDELVPVLDDLLAWHGRGTRFGIRVDADGLLAAGEPGVQLTWMDARVGERVITPRHGKPVEIQALWINALRIMAELHARFGRPTRAKVLDRLADAAAARFDELFWNEDAQALFDVVDGERGDATLRPNQLYALALPWPSLAPDRARAVLATVERELVTPLGLRSLAPGDPAYVARYQGGPELRDAAYHQGTVWPFLVGIYVCALLRYRGAAGVATARQAIATLAANLAETGLGSISEIADADSPHAPRGAIAQAWSVAELLRAWRAVELEGAP
jgi:predicted glycogen debranching enzyme